MAVNRSELTVARPITYAAVSRAKNEAGIAASRLWPCRHQLPCSSVNWAFDTGRAGRSLGLGPFSRSGAVGAGCHRGTSNTHLNPSSSPRAASRIGPCAPLGRPCHLAAAGRWGWGSLPSPDGCPSSLGRSWRLHAAPAIGPKGEGPWVTLGARWHLRWSHCQRSCWPAPRPQVRDGSRSPLSNPCPTRGRSQSVKSQSGRQDSNLRPSAPKANTLG